MPDVLEFSAEIVNPSWMPSWQVVEVPESNEFFGTGASVRADATLDGVTVTSSLMPSGQGYHFISISKALAKKLGKGVGDAVMVRAGRCTD